MDCKEALDIIGEWLQLVLFGQVSEEKARTGGIEEAIEHIRKCDENKCSAVWRELNGALISIKGIDIDNIPECP